MNTTLQALVNQAERQVRAESYEEAIALCHAILRRYPRYARCYRILGEAYLGLGEQEEAANLFRRALGVDVEDPIAYAGLSLIFEERGLLEEAIWQLERAFELAPGRDELRRELARLYGQRGSLQRVMLTRGALARLYARGGLLNKAIGELQGLLAREPYRLDLRVALARTLWRAGQRREAAEASQSILEVAPNCLVARLILGTFWCQTGRDDDGRALLQGAQELDPENREAARLLGAESLLPLRVARLETTDADLAGEDLDLELEDAWPASAPAAATDGEAPLAGELAGEAKPEEHIVMLPALPASLFAGEPLPVDLLEPDLTPLDAPEASEAPLADATVRLLAEEPLAGEAHSDANPAREVAPADEDAAVGMPAVAAIPDVLSPLSALRRRLEEEPGDHDAGLALARALVEGGMLAEALPLYDALASPETGFLDDALADLEAIARSDTGNRALRELLGDVYARASRFEEAMHVYRWLLEH